jgi:hypothetical protein
MMDTTWSPEALRVLERAEERHGGRERWRRVRSISLAPVSLGGPLPLMKGYPRTFGFPPRVEIFPSQRRACFLSYPHGGQRGVFENGDLRIETDAATPTVLTESRAHRRTFAGLRKYRRWDALDGLYFFGYALLTYVAIPFILRDLRFVSLRHARFRGEPLEGLTVDFPANFDTHCRRQTFYFDRSGLLRRHDYTADVVGGWARGAHFSDDYEEVDGFSFARRRWVRARFLGLPTLQAQLGGFAVTLDRG